MLDEIRLKPCRRCGGLPVVLVQPGWPMPRVCVICTVCSEAGTVFHFAKDGPTWYQGWDRVLVPDLATARRQAAADWNEGDGSS